MPLSSEIDTERGWVITTCRGRLTLDEVLQHIDRLSLDPDLPEAFDELVDLRGVEWTDLFSAGLRQVVAIRRQHLERLSEHSRLAIVASSNLMYGIARMFEMLGESQLDRIRTFRTMEGARRWLEHTEPDDDEPEGAP